MSVPGFDPRLLIGPPFDTCPSCGGAEFGTLAVSNRRVDRKCRGCSHLAYEQLPGLAKRVIYLDQMVYSNMAKALDPVWAATRGPQDPYWQDLFDALDRAFKLQLIVCPYSTIHEKESALSAQPGMLQRIYEHLSGGVSFEYPTRVHLIQWAHGFGRVLRRLPPDYEVISRSSMLHGDPDTWTPQISINVNFPEMGVDAEAQRGVLTRSHAALLEWQRRWQEEDRDFDYWYRFERSGMPYTVMSLYRDHIELIHKVSTGAAPFSEDVWNPRLEVETVPSLSRVAEELGLHGAAATNAALAFLASETGMDAPANDISALLMAALARKARSGQKRSPTRGMWNDITAIACFLPYSDAMFVDDECAGLLRDQPLRSRIRYGTRVFSNNTRNELIQWLRGLEDAAGGAHVRLVERVYGSSWTTPFREILQYERERPTKAEHEG
jgi:hypothetical protein